MTAIISTVGATALVVSSLALTVWLIAEQIRGEIEQRREHWNLSRYPDAFWHRMGIHNTEGE